MLTKEDFEAAAVEKTRRIDILDKDVRKQELDMARSLVESLADEWTPAKCTDDYRDNLMRLIKAKLKGKPADLAVEEHPRDANVVDLMERLRRSLEEPGRKTKAAKRASRRGASGRAQKQRRSRRVA